MIVELLQDFGSLGDVFVWMESEATPTIQRTIEGIGILSDQVDEGLTLPVSRGSEHGIVRVSEIRTYSSEDIVQYASAASAIFEMYWSYVSAR